MEKITKLLQLAVLVMAGTPLCACTDEFRWRTAVTDLCSSSAKAEVPALGHFNSQNLAAMLLNPNNHCGEPLPLAAIGEKQAQHVKNYLQGITPGPMDGYATQNRTSGLPQ